MGDQLYREATTTEAMRWKETGAVSLIGVSVELEDGGSGVYEEHSDPEYIGRRFQIWFEHPDSIEGGDDD